MRALACIAMSLFVLALSARADCATADRESFNIPPQGLELALQSLAGQTGLHVIFASEDLADRKTAGVSGQLTSEQALAQLLTGTGLTYRYLNTNTVTILPSTAQAARSEAGGASGGGGTGADQVTVTAPRQYDAQQMSAAVNQFIESHSLIREHDAAISQWHVGVCPTTSGLSDEANAFVSKRVQEIAAAMGVPSGPKYKCPNSNTNILFMPHPADFWNSTLQQCSQAALHRASVGKSMRQLQATIGACKRVQAAYPPAPGGQPYKFDHPVQALYITHDRWFTPGFGRPSLPMAPQGPRSAPFRQAFRHVLVVVDTDQVSAYPLDTVAHYIAMLTLAQAQSLDGCDQLPSILDLWSSTCGTRERPRSLTDADRSFLTALYSMFKPWSVEGERQDIAVVMAREIQRTSAPPLP